MIKGLYETHLYVENLEISIDFYKNILGLDFCYSEKERRVAFFWIGKTKEAMLGIWEKPKEQIDKRHFAFKCETDFILNESFEFLKSHNLKPRNFLSNGKEEPMVFAWVPAISIYFEDPDGHSLEFISVLEGESKPENGIITYEKWLELENK
ncbi:VOC family protein [Flavobacterium sp. 5]|uniref:VOC family protein n=1 Tax=Flavobacterium sp. 5 TaxID=2035199 RepID=UPI000C2C5AC3|nr:VOC family protein [Flavobacterium sp. 5]PKB15358.1 catechol 2,3-dioxygenase-like lactoylglutathione lyase family enzyme [Flavobacterium sp. 5]